jgi:hypothetical protein
MRSFALALTVVLAATAPSSAAWSAPAFPLRPSPDGRHLVDAAGRPFLYQADTAWKLFVALDLAEAEEYLRARKNQGFTAVQVMLTGFQGDRTRGGHAPFEADDFARPDEAYFAHVDAVVEKAGQQGLALFMAPLWAGCCGEGWAGKSKDGRPKPMEVNGPEKSRAFGRWLGQRYARHPHVSWILGGDNDPGTAREAMRALALGLREAAPSQLITYHAASSHSSTDAWPGDEGWLGVSMIYTYFRGFDKAWNKNQPDVYEEAARERAKTPARPFFLGESTYEGEHGAWGSARQARKQAYWAMLGGASGHAYGSPNWHLRDDWRKTLHLPGAESLRHLLHLFTVRPWHELAPDEAGTLLVDGRGPPASNDHATAARSPDGRFAVAYLPSSRAVTVDLTRVAGARARVSWFDPRTGLITDAGVHPTRGRKTFRPPGGPDEDWLLVAEDAAADLPPLGPARGAAATLLSVDHRGLCRRGRPVTPGETTVHSAERGLSLVAHGSEYGHHCGQDQGRFAYVAIEGDFDVAVQVAAISNGGARHFKGHATPAKGGLMAREGNGPADRYVAIWAVSNDDPEHYPDAYHFDARFAREAWLGSSPKGAFTYGYVNRRHQAALFTRDYPHVWVRLARTGNRFSAYVGNDGKTWTPTSTPSFDVDLPRVLYVGVALSSAPESSFEARSAARFQNLSGLPVRADRRASSKR